MLPNFGSIYWTILYVVKKYPTHLWMSFSLRKGSPEFYWKNLNNSIILFRGGRPAHQSPACRVRLEVGETQLAQIMLKFHLKKTEIPHMTPKGKKSLISTHKRLLHIRYQITQYQLDGKNPPENLVKELKDLERTIRLFNDKKE